MAPREFPIANTGPQCLVVPIRQRRSVKLSSGGSNNCHIQDPKAVQYLGIMFRRVIGYHLSECTHYISSSYSNEEGGKNIFIPLEGQPGAAYSVNFKAERLHRIPRFDGPQAKYQCLNSQIPVKGLADKKLSTPVASDLKGSISGTEDDSIEDYDFEDNDYIKIQPKLRRHSDYEAALSPRRLQMFSCNTERALTQINKSGAVESKKDSSTTTTYGSTETLNYPDADTQIAASPHQGVCHKTNTSIKNCPYLCKSNLPVGAEVKPSQDEKATSKFNDILLRDIVITGSVPSLDTAASLNLCVPYLTMTFGAVSGAGLFSWEQSPETVGWATIIPMTLLWTTVLCTLGLPLSMLMADEIKELQENVKMCIKDGERMIYEKDESTYDTHDETLEKEYKRRARSGGGKTLLDVERSGRTCRCIKCNTKARKIAIYCTIFLPPIFAAIAFVSSMVSLFALMFVTEKHTTAIRATVTCIPATLAFIVAMGLILHRRWSATS